MNVAKRLTASALISLAVLASGCGLIPRAESWNFLVYLDGDNNLEPDAIDDFNEMERVGSSANLKILVLIDRSPLYDQSNENWTDTRLYLVTKDSDPNIINSTPLAYYGELDMSDPATLRDFLVYCQTNYPADHTALTLWNHGGGVWPRAVQPGGVSPPPPSGPFKGIVWDDTTGAGDWDCLTTDEVAQALAAARQAPAGRRLDVINMDACIMQMLEVAYEWKDEADYLVGSEENVPEAGNDYALTLSYLKRFSWLSPERFAYGLVESYRLTYEAYNTTYSALSLGRDFDDLVTAFAGFAKALNETEDLPGVYAAWQDTTSFSGVKYGHHENKDLYSFASEIEAHVADPPVASAAASVRQALARAIVKHAETGWYAGKAFGLSVLLPSATEWADYSGTDQYVTLKLSQDTSWDEFIGKFVTYTPGP